MGVISRPLAAPLRSISTLCDAPMSDQPESSHPAEAVHPLMAIDIQQDEILRELDALNHRIEAALAEFGRFEEERRAA